MRVVYTGGEGEITEKKSRFIATVKPVQSEEEAVASLMRQRKNTGMPVITVLLLSSGRGRS